jgi:uncharacterized tellurite resistance protein B-like protein
MRGLLKERNTKMEKRIWFSEITSDMVANLDEDTIEELVEALNDVVMATCLDFGVE